jgi:glycosyltransferase involved in cell wall biosynthesis
MNESPSEPELSVVIPAYNEAARIEPSLEHIRTWLAEHEPSAEVLVVDDGSRDSTAEVVRREVARYDASGLRLRLLGDDRNRGKGAAVRTGMLEARGRIVLFTDADLSAPIEEAPKLLEPIRAGEVPIVIGSRGVDKSMIGVHQPMGREIAGRVFNFASRYVTGLAFKDMQCGFKAFRRDASHDVFSRIRIERFGFDVEALFLARKLGYEVREVSVVWNNVEGSKVGLASGAHGFVELARIRLNHLRGLYETPSVEQTVSTTAK